MTELDEIYEELNILIDRELGITKPPLALDEKARLRALQEKAHKIGLEKVKQEAIEKEEKSREMKRRRGRGRYGEQRLAKKVGGVVVGRSKWIAGVQINCQQPPDVIAPINNPIFSFEVKYLKRVPKFLDKIMIQATRNCPAGLIPIGVVSDRENKVTCYIMSEKDFIDLHC